MIGGGVKHTTNVARLLAYAAFGGREGVADPTSLQVRQGVVVGNTFRVAPGACSILNRNPGTAYDAYAARKISEETVTLPATGAGAGRTDLVLARVKNPFLSGEPYPEPSPAEIANGTAVFVETYVMQGMPGPTPGSHPTLAQVRAAIGSQSAIPLASIARAANLDVISSLFIKDWRELVRPMPEETTTRVANPASTTTVTTSFQTVGPQTITIPTWATHVSMTATAGGVQHTSGDVAGEVRVSLGTLNSQVTIFNVNSPNTDRAVFMTGEGMLPVPLAMRGTSQTVGFGIRKTTGTPTVTVNSTSTISYSLTFHQRTESI
jgi:hypothetical protein